MNRPNYSPEGIEVRVASMEDCCLEAIEEGKTLPMTATVIPEVRYLLDKIRSRRKELPQDVTEKLDEIEVRLIDLERKRGAIRAGRFIRISASIVPDMRYILDQLGVKRSEQADDGKGLWEVEKTELAEAV